MIQYALKCDEGHRFDSWFQSADSFDTLKRAGHVTCAVCGSSEVSKELMAPRLNKSDGKTTEAAPATKPPETSEPDAAALQELRQQIEKNATYVGGSFAKEARAQHLGDAPERPIYGEANGKEAKALIEDGIPVAPLPFIPKQKAN